MLAIPLKHGKSLDVANPLRALLAEVFDESVADRYTESCAKVQANRDVCLTVSSKKPTVQQLSFFSTYLRNLGSLQSKFPPADQQRLMHLNCPFSWQDTFITSKTVDYGTLDGEKAAVLFNFAALHSRLGVNGDLDNPADLVMSMDYFKMSASLFLYLRDELLTTSEFARTADLSHEGLTMVGNMMLAQAQLCFFRKARAGQLSYSVTSKLAKGTADYFNLALTASRTKYLKDALAESWGNNIEFQRGLYMAYAEYFKGLDWRKQAEETTEGFGKSLSHLQEAKSQLQKALNTGTQRGLSHVVLGHGKSLLNEVDKALNTGEKDNELIYLDPIPPRSRLPELEGHAIVKPDTSKFESWWTGGLSPDIESPEDVLHGLLPGKVEKLAAQFSRQYAETLTTAETDVSGEIERVRGMLASANLPHVIEAGDPNGSGVPDDLFSRIQGAVQTRQGAQGLLQEIAANRATNQQLYTRLQQCQQMLSNAEQHHKDMKNRYGDRWNLPDPAQADAPLKKDCLKLLGYLSEGRKNDDLLEQQLRSPEQAALMDNLMLDKHAMGRLLPHADPDDDETVEDVRTSLRMSYISLDSKIADCEQALRDLRSSLTSEVAGFKREMTGIGEVDPNEDYVGIKLAQNMGRLDDVYSIKESLSGLLARVLEDCARYMASRQESPASQERTAAIGRLDAALGAFESSGRHIFEGKMFYEGLIGKVDKLEGLTKDGDFTRTFISSELETALKESTSNTQQKPAAIRRQKSDPFMGNNLSYSTIAAGSPASGNGQVVPMHGNQPVDQQGFPVLRPAAQQVNPYAYNPAIVPGTYQHSYPPQQQPYMVQQPYMMQQPPYQQQQIPYQQPIPYQQQPQPAQVYPVPPQMNTQQQQQPGGEDKSKRGLFGRFRKKKT